MLNPIVAKLHAELQTPILATQENRVVYILSRIRKVLEIESDSNQGNYKKLKFYCDWALHKELTKGTKVFQKELESFVQGNMEAGASVLTYEVFETEFLAFLNQYNIPSAVYNTAENRLTFREILAGIYSDTPLIVTLERKYKITTNAGVFTRESGTPGRAEIGFRIDPLD